MRFATDGSGDILDVLVLGRLTRQGIATEPSQERKQ